MVDKGEEKFNKEPTFDSTMLKSRQHAVDLCPRASQSDRAHGVRQLQHKYWKCPRVADVLEWNLMGSFSLKCSAFHLFCKTASDKSIKISVQCFPQDIYVYIYIYIIFLLGWKGLWHIWTKWCKPSIKANSFRQRHFKKHFSLWSLFTDKTACCCKAELLLLAFVTGI